MCNAAATDIPLHRYKQLLISIACDLPENELVLRVILFLSSIFEIGIMATNRFE